MCCKDLWYLEVEAPPPAGRVALIRASTGTLEINWNPMPTAQAYLLEVQKIDLPPRPPTPPQPAAIPISVAKKPAISPAQIGNIISHLSVRRRVALRCVQT